MKHDDLVWLAGLLEGEGCFTTKSRTPHVALKMTDLDIVERAALLMKDENVTIERRAPNRKDVFAANVTGTKAIKLMELIQPLMGKRRSARISEILAWAEARPGQAYGERQGKAKLRAAWIPWIRGLSERGFTSRRLASICGVSHTAIQQVVRGETWRSV